MRPRIHSSSVTIPSTNPAWATPRLVASPAGHAVSPIRPKTIARMLQRADQEADDAQDQRGDAHAVAAPDRRSAVPAVLVALAAAVGRVGLRRQRRRAAGTAGARASGGCRLWGLCAALVAARAGSDSGSGSASRPRRTADAGGSIGVDRRKEARTGSPADRSVGSGRHLAPRAPEGSGGGGVVMEANCLRHTRFIPYRHTVNGGRKLCSEPCELVRPEKATNE